MQLLLGFILVLVGIWGAAFLCSIFPANSGWETASVLSGIFLALVGFCVGLKELFE